MVRQQSYVVDRGGMEANAWREAGFPQEGDGNQLFHQLTNYEFPN